MKKTRHTEAQIAFALRQAESGTAVSEIVRKMGISEATFYRWKQKFDGLGVAEMPRLKQLDEETGPRGRGPASVLHQLVALNVLTFSPYAGALGDRDDREDGGDDKQYYGSGDHMKSPGVTKR